MPETGQNYKGIAWGDRPQRKGRDGVGLYIPQTFDSVMYPSDLNTNRDGSNTPDAVCFTIMKRIGMSIDDVSDAATDTLKMMGKAIEIGFGEAEISEKDNLKMKKILDNKDLSKKEQKEQIEEIGTTAFAAKGEKLPDSFFETMKAGLFMFGDEVVGAQQRVRKKQAARKALNVRKGGEDILGSIYMNMPAGITFNDKANWGEKELGMMGKASKTLITGGDSASVLAGGAVGAGGNVAAAGITGVGTLVARMGLKGGLVGAAIGAAAAGSSLQQGAEAALGVSMNPYMEMMFSGVSFRDFQFDFTMRPRNYDEFQKIEKIISLFREHSRPSWQGGKLGKSFMNYPMVYKIEFLTTTGKGDAESYMTNTNIPQLKTCVCDSVTTNYAPQNMWTAHENGVPVAVTLGLHFQETELVMAQDVSKDWNDLAAGGY